MIRNRLAETKRTKNVSPGLSRILAASAEVLSTQTELRWPEVIVPYTVNVILPKPGSKEDVQGTECALDLYDRLNTQVYVNDCVVDDRSDMTVGRKLREALKTGYRYVYIFVIVFT